MRGQAQHAKKDDSAAIWQARHFPLAIDGKVATVTLNRSARKNPLTFGDQAVQIPAFDERSISKIKEALHA